MRKIVLLSAIFCLLTSPVSAWVNIEDENWQKVNEYSEEYIEFTKNENYAPKDAFYLLQKTMGVLSYSDADSKTVWLYGGYLYYLMAKECQKLGYNNEVFLEIAKNTKIINRKNKINKKSVEYLLMSFEEPKPDTYEYETYQTKKKELLNQPVSAIVNNHLR